MAKSNVKELDIFEEAGVETVEEYFALLDAGFDKLVKQRIAQEKQVANEQHKAMQNVIEDFTKKRFQLEKLGIKDVEAYRLYLIEEFEKKKKEQDIKLINEEMKAQYNIQTKYDKKRQDEERRARDQLNKETLEFYKELRKQLKPGEDLTEAQKEDEKKKQEEVRKTEEERKTQKAYDKLVAAISKLDGSITKYSQYSAGINARLQGFSPNVTSYERFKVGVQTFGNQPFQLLESRLTSAVGLQPYFKTETMLDNLQMLVETGIASNVDQRAFLQTAKDDIATTFDVANGALLRIIRLQQSDSTAARLGLEAYLTRFLNQMFENTEYLTQTFDNVQEALLEASSFMTTEASTEFEYIVQKWLGSLTSVGLSEATATNIAQAIGYLGSGNIEALSSSNLQNLLVMAASRRGLNYADLLTSGLSAEKTDVLMQSLVEYMTEIGTTSSNVVRSQFAQTFGLSYSDLRAAQQLVDSINDIAGNFLSYEGMYDELKDQMYAIPGRMGTATMFDNLWANLQFGLASNISKNPVLAALWKVTGLIQENTGGINIPSFTAMTVGTGGGFDLEATIDNLIRLGVVGVSSLGMIGDLVSGLGSTFAPGSILGKLGIKASGTSISRGKGLEGRDSGLDTSTSIVTKTISPGGGEQYQESVYQQQSDEASQKQQGMQQEQENPLDDIKAYLIDTFSGKFDTLVGYVQELRDKVVDGEIEISNYSQKEGFINDLLF